MTAKKLLLLILFIRLSIPLFDKDLYITSSLEQMELNRRYGYYSKEMGDFYTKNKVMRFYLNRIFPITNKYLYKLAHFK